jgi:tRNA nucleotidyltransferase (CCA-adding enzyme)
MQVYLVGGAVRDKLLGIKNTDKDYVVVGSTPQEMLSLGYKQVGKDFPVFLHPKTHEEYALARIERKQGQGYKGFEFETKNVSLKEDLSRRDLTINSMAMDENGELIDYFGGEEDLQMGLLRHTSKAFIEDPVRVLRIARFSAKFKPFGFKVAHSTFKLLKHMVENGEVDNLVSERVFTELNKALTYPTPSAFFKVLATCGAYEKIFKVTITKNMDNTHHNAFAFLDNILTTAEVKFALWTTIHSLAEIKTLCQTLKTPKKYKKLATLSKQYMNIAQNFHTHTAEQKLEFFHHTDAIRQHKRFGQLLEVFKYFNINIKTIQNLHHKLQHIDTTTLDKQNIITEIKNLQLKICKM